MEYQFNAGGKFQRRSLSSFSAGGGSFNAGGASSNAGVMFQRRRLRRRSSGIGQRRRWVVSPSSDKVKTKFQQLQAPAPTPEVAPEDLWHWKASGLGEPTHRLPSEMIAKYTVSTPEVAVSTLEVSFNAAGFQRQSLALKTLRGGG